ncbi:type III effector protein [uncultured Streptomyces sp.]|uniref:type III effector protein n=1 Tax=uncultured Streptomyces sp. TaxID=174707 RepID=UPI00261A3229|nr:type III effector protein [uncultured Streptomyces sp.]
MAGPPPSDAADDPTSFLAAETALNAIDRAVRTARTPPEAEPGEDGSVGGPGAGSPDGKEMTSVEQALAALLLLRELRGQLAAWEPGLIEAARAAGASWADLAHPLGVASRQAAERRYLRVRPGTPGSTAEERVQATRGRRAADRTLVAWARDNAAPLRQLAGQITALTDLAAPSRTPVARLADALAQDDAARLIDPLTATHAHLTTGHPDLAVRVDTLTRHAERLRGGADASDVPGAADVPGASDVPGPDTADMPGTPGTPGTATAAGE